MGLVTGLDAIRKRASGGDRQRANFLSLKDGDKKKIWFLQELDESSDNYDEEAGLGALVVEYRDPKNFRKRIVDTSDTEGRCWPAEQGWKPRVSLYIAVAVEDGDGYEVQILNQGFGPKSVVNWLVEYAGDAGSITNLPFKISRTGSGQFDTSYSLVPAGPGGEPLSREKYGLEIPDFEKVLMHVPYERQRDFFLGDGSASEEEEESSGTEAGSVWG